jgi:hypothetical protein
VTNDIELEPVNQGTALTTGALALCRTANRLGARSRRRSGVRRPRAHKDRRRTSLVIGCGLHVGRVVFTSAA